MADLDFCDLYDQKIEPNRCQLIKYIETGDILDELRQNRTISIDDYEEVQACGNRRRLKTAKLLDILQTKGDNGVKEFLKSIELMYPDLYQAVTGESPRKPPPNFLRKSRMPSLRTINHLPQLAQDLKTQYQHNKQLVQQLQELENAMVFEQNDNKELEKENSELRRRIDSLRNGRDALESQVASFMTENHKLKDESLSYLKTSLEYHQQSELYKQRAREIQIEKDELERTLIQKQKERNEERNSRLSFGVCLRPTQPDTSITSTDVTDQSTREANLMLQQQMMNEKLDEMQQELAQTAEDLHMSRTQTDEYQNLYKNVKDTCERLKKERTKMDSLLEKQLSTTNHYFEMIQKLEADKKMLEEERIKEQKKVSEESEKRNKLFMEKHKLGQEYTVLCTEVEHLRTDIKKRNSQESQDSSDDQISHVQSSDGDVATTRDKRSGIYSNHSSIHVHPGTVRNPSDLDLDHGRSRLNTQVAQMMVSGPRNDDDEVPQRTYRHGKLKNGQYVTMEMIDELPSEDKSFRSDDSVNTSEGNGQCPVIEDMTPPSISPASTKPITLTIKLPTPLLKDKFEITGGNMTGIFVKKVNKKKFSNIQEGDKISSVGVFITDVQALHTDLVYRTLEEATHIIQAQADPSHANVVEIKLQRDPEEYERALQWIKQQGSGDLFYVKSNFTLEEENSCPNIQNGDIFCVCSTMVGTANKYWKAFRFDKGNNSWSSDPISLPNVSEVLKLRRGGMSANRQRGRQQAFRHRPYSRVLPTKSPGTDYSTDSEVLSMVFPVNTKFSGKVHWHKEGKLEMLDVEKYRHLLGYSSDVSFTATSIDLESDSSNICNSICLSNEESFTE